MAWMPQIGIDGWQQPMQMSDPMGMPTNITVHRKLLTDAKQEYRIVPF